MKALLIAAVVVAFQIFVFGGYQLVLAMTRSRKSAIVLLSWLAGTVVVALFAFALLKAACHECATVPSAIVCPHSNHAFDWELQSKRVGGFIKERQLGGCFFYENENTTGGN